MVNCAPAAASAIRCFERSFHRSSRGPDCDAVSVPTSALVRCWSHMFFALSTVSWPRNGRSCTGSGVLLGRAGPWLRSTHRCGLCAVAASRLLGRCYLRCCDLLSTARPPVCFSPPVTAVTDASLDARFRSLPLCRCLCDPVLSRCDVPRRCVGCRHKEGSGWLLLLCRTALLSV